MLWKKDGSSFEIRTQGELPDGLLTTGSGSASFSSEASGVI